MCVCVCEDSGRKVCGCVCCLGILLISFLDLGSIVKRAALVRLDEQEAL